MVLLLEEPRLILSTCLCIRTGGNQRELARAKAAKKQNAKPAAESTANKGLTLEQRKARSVVRTHFHLKKLADNLINDKLCPRSIVVYWRSLQYVVSSFPVMSKAQFMTNYFEVQNCRFVANICSMNNEYSCIPWRDLQVNASNYMCKIEQKCSSWFRRHFKKEKIQQQSDLRTWLARHSANWSEVFEWTKFGMLRNEMNF